MNNFRSLHCSIIHDLLTLAKLLEQDLLSSSSLLQRLKLKFVIVGSTIEGSRIGIGNEVDLTMIFEAWEKNPPFKISGDAFHLYKGDSCPKWMDIYFNEERQFLLEPFIHDLCKAIEESLDIIFTKQQQPQYLVRVKSNKDYERKPCATCKTANTKIASLFVQCPSCVVCVSRTKMGLCLQFERQNKEIVYCSMDLVPFFYIQEEDTKKVIKMVNGAMLGREHPQDWYKNIGNFVKEDQLVAELWSEGEKIDRVLLKSLSSGNYFIRGGQHLRPDMLLQNDNLLKAYSYLKALRTLLEVENLSNFMMKKMLMQPTFIKMASEENDTQKLIGQILMHSKFKPHFESVARVGEKVRDQLHIEFEHNCKFPDF